METAMHIPVLGPLSFFPPLSSAGITFPWTFTWLHPHFSLLREPLLAPLNNSPTSRDTPSPSPA